MKSKTNAEAKNLEIPSKPINFHDVTIDHNCILEASPNLLDLYKNRIKKFIGSFIIIAKAHPNTKMYFKSDVAVMNEVKRHIRSDFSYIIHPYSKFRFLWNLFLACTFYLLLLEIPFVFAFNREPGVSTLHLILLIFSNAMCLLDIFVTFFTGYWNNLENYVVLHQPSIIINYLRDTFILDFLACLPFNSIAGLADFSLKNESVLFYASFMVASFRIFSINKLFKYFNEVAENFKLSYIRVVIIESILKSLLFTHWCACVSKIFLFEKLLENDSSYVDKYFQVLYFVLWSLFGQSFGTQLKLNVHGNTISSICMVLGSVYTIHLAINILNIMNTINSSSREYLEVMNQLDGYMDTKRFPISLQDRLRCFYNNKFRKSYFNEDAIIRNLSEPLRREILINMGQLFVERVQIFKNIPSSVVSVIVSCMKRERYLPHDLIVKAGAVGERMYFISYGTVVITSTNGKEIYHLHDGDHFGEIALILKNHKRIANAIAIEFCEIFCLEYADFHKHVQVNHEIMTALQEIANNRMLEITLKAELHKQELLKRVAANQ